MVRTSGGNLLGGAGQLGHNQLTTTNLCLAPVSWRGCSRAYSAIALMPAASRAHLQFRDPSERKCRGDIVLVDGKRDHERSRCVGWIGRRRVLLGLSATYLPARCIDRPNAPMEGPHGLDGRSYR